MSETRDWLSIFKAWECSHLSQTAFCEQESIALKPLPSLVQISGTIILMVLKWVGCSIAP